MSAPRTRRSTLWSVWTSFGLLRSLSVLGAVVLAVALPPLELRLDLPLTAVLPSAPSGARSVLSSIITSMISFTALVFSITVKPDGTVAATYQGSPKTTPDQIRELVSRAS